MVWTGVLLLACVVCASHAADVVFRSDGGETKVNVTSSVVDGVTVSPRTSELTLKKLESDEEGIQKITGLRNLENLHMTNGNYANLPVLAGLPKLHNLMADGNRLQLITKNQLGARNVSLQKVFLGNNEIWAIESEAFGPQVTELFIYCNELKIILPDWFQNPLKLTYLSIKYNKIKYLQRNALKDFLSLKTIDLSGNEVIHIDEIAFPAHNRFHSVNLAYNKLNELPDSMFNPGDLYIQRMYIMNNNLTYINSTLLKRMRTGWLYIRENPWSCACYQAIQNSRDFETEEQTRNEVLCLSPDSLNTKNCTETVDTKLQKKFASILKASPDNYYICNTKTLQNEEDDLC